jgi:hypothetical protein
LLTRKNGIDVVQIQKDQLASCKSIRGMWVSFSLTCVQPNNVKPKISFETLRSPDDLPLHDVMQRNFSLFFRCGKKVGMDESGDRSIGSEFGGAGRDRTDDLKLAKLALSQLSYGPEGLPASVLEGANEWWAWEDLNFRPHAYQARALTS